MEHSFVPSPKEFSRAIDPIAVRADRGPARAPRRGNPRRRGRPRRRASRPPPLVVRGDATAVPAPCGEDGCPVELAGGRFRAAPLGAGAYAGSLTVAVADAFPNGEGGSCAPLAGRIVLGAGSPDRLVLAVAGDSCQDGAGPLEAASFTGLARFAVKRSTGRYARVRGAGLATFTEDAAKHHRMTLVGHLAG